MQESENVQMIEAIMRKGYKMSEVEGFKKFANKFFDIVKKDNTTYVIDKRKQPYIVHSTIRSAYENIILGNERR